MSKIAILTDSGCQIGIKDEHRGVYVVPLCITINEKTYLDQIHMSSIEVFEKMNKENLNIKTSQPSTGELVKAIREIKEDGYDEIIAISIATGLSSTLNGMRIACDMEEIEVTLVDSMGTALIQKYLIETAVKLVGENKNAEEIKEILDSMVKESRTIILAPNLEHLKRGGRITPAVALLAGMLKIIPVMELNFELGGKIDTLTKVRTLKKASATLIDRMIELGVNNKDYLFAIEHVLSSDIANDMKNLLEEKIGACNVVIRELPSVVGAHMGVGGIGVQFIKKYQ